MMSVHELIRELSYYPPNMKVVVRISDSTLLLDPCGTNYEFKMPNKLENNRVILEVS